MKLQCFTWCFKWLCEGFQDPIAALSVFDSQRDIYAFRLGCLSGYVYELWTFFSCSSRYHCQNMNTCLLNHACKMVLTATVCGDLGCGVNDESMFLRLCPLFVQNTSKHNGRLIVDELDAQGASE